MNGVASPPPPREGSDPFAYTSYIAEMCSQLQQMADAMGYSMLAYMLDMSRAEAEAIHAAAEAMATGTRIAAPPEDSAV